ncbi:MAG: hypothetical protein JXB45_03230 [Candidatus Krumholzibacteriota bacterium]|nr:hypothetical protein [Candidatus Krumholzibacteriota bacterium]
MMVGLNRTLPLMVLGLILLLSGNGSVRAEGGSSATAVSPHLEEPIVAGRNLVYCATFQLAWNQMKEDIIRDDIVLEKPLDCVRHLNRGLSTIRDIDENDYLARAGLGRDKIASRINQELQVRFGRSAPRVEDRFDRDDVILAYAFLRKELRFENRFQVYARALRFGGGTDFIPVEAFGIGPENDSTSRPARAQVEVIDYRDRTDFIIRLRSDEPREEIILARINPSQTILSTLERIEERIKAGSPRIMGDDDILLIPKLELSIDYTFTPLLGLFLLNAGFEDYFVQEARQDVRFRLDESGASVESQGVFALKKGGASGKSLIVDGPFMLYIKRKDGGYPYFAMWVENADNMVRSR